ncbi:MAG: hypothetical protein U9M90_03105 [Patescibacteria group bacterium]|nr:hypothetical protein [Patescibacteria group bacterium]
MQISIKKESIEKIQSFLEKRGAFLVILVLSLVSLSSFYYYYNNGLGIAYNDARSHLDIGRRVVEGLNPGLAQLGSVWLPLTHLLMALTIWNDFMWHSGLAGAIQSMVAFAATGVLIYLFLKEFKVGLFGRFLAVAVFASNLNLLYLQSTAMTELVLIGTMTAGAYFLLLWHKSEKLYHIILSAFFIMLSTLVRYDGWFLFFFATCLVFFRLWRKRGWNEAEGMTVLFCTLGGSGIIFWLLWNLVIFGDPLYFAFGPYSAHTQQTQLNAAGVLPTRFNILESAKIYWYALAYNSGAFVLLLGIIGGGVLWLNRKISFSVRFASLVLLAPWIFNIIALYLGHSVLYIQGLSGDTWFNVRYGVMMMPSLAIFIGYLVHRAEKMRWVLAGLLVFVAFFQFSSTDAVTIDDARVGSSQKNVSEVSGWLKKNAANKKGFILISAASHDSIIFSSGLPMKKFIHEGAGAYYEAAIKYPGHWARWIVVRSYSDNDSTWRLLKDNEDFQNHYELVDHYPFADIYQLKVEYLDGLETEPVLDPKVKKTTR